MSDLAADKNDIEYHDLLIYGYSDEKEEFYFADNYEGGKYEFGVASYKEIENAINDYDGDDTRNINCLKYRNDKTWKIFEFDKKTYISFLRDYIEQTNCTRCWGVPGVEYKFLEQKRWGIGVYAYIHEYLDAVQKAEIETGNRALYVIREHKNILEKTLTYLLGVQWKETYPQEWKLLEMNIQMANKVLDLFEKYERSFEINSYPKYGHMFSIVGAHTQEYLPWVYNFFVQLWSQDKLSDDAGVNYMDPDILMKFPWAETNKIKKEIGFKMMNGLDLIKYCIDSDYYFYVILKVDEIAAYQNRLHYHDLMIYGYSDEKKEFYFADNYKNGIYGRGVASYKEIENAINNNDKSDKLDILCLKYRNNKNWKTFEFDKDAYISFLYDYIEQTKWVF